MLCVCTRVAHCWTALRRQCRARVRVRSLLVWGRPCLPASYMSPTRSQGAGGGRQAGKLASRQHNMLARSLARSLALSLAARSSLAHGTHEPYTHRPESGAAPEWRVFAIVGPHGTPKQGGFMLSVRRSRHVPTLMLVGSCESTPTRRARIVKTRTSLHGQR